MAGELQRRAAEFRRDLLQLERSAASDMVRAYGVSWQRIEARVTDLWNEVTALREAGQPVPPVRLMQLDRYLRLQDEITAELRHFAQYADGSVRATQLAAVDMAQQHSPRLISAVASESEIADLQQFIDFAHAPRQAVEAMVGYAQGNTPLGALLDAIPNQVNSSVRDTLIAGLTLGQNPRETARQVRRAFGTGLARALTISRTETLRAYREATRLDYLANDDIIEGWVWSAACDRRTCVTCWALHGRVYKLQRQMPAHPNCRCAMVPMLKKQYRGDYEPTAGAVLFDQAGPEVQRAVLGPGAYQEYQSGRVKIEDFVTFRRSRDWGITVQRSSLGDAMNRARSRPQPAPQTPQAQTPVAQVARTRVLEVGQPHQEKLRTISSDLETLRASQASIEAEMKQLSTQGRKFTGFGGGFSSTPSLTDEARKQMTVLQNRYDDIVKQVIQLDGQRKAVQKQIAETAREHLAPANPAKISLTTNGFSAPEAIERLKRGADGFNSLVDSSVIREQVVKAQSYHGRAYYDTDNKSVYISSGHEERTMVHELGHWLEGTNPDIHDKIVEFYDRRTKGEPLEWIGEGYGQDEVTRRDKFIHPYMGKEYLTQGKRDATEILSMGLEYFYAEPLKLAQEDPEYFDFIYNLVRGNG